MNPRSLVPLLTAGLLALTPAWAREPAAPRAVTPRGPLLAQEQQVVNLFESTAPSVAYITTEVVQMNGFFLRPEVSQGAGSGFVWDASGHVVTNNHVVEDARRVFVQLDAGNPIEATLVGRSPEYDLAVVKLSRVPKDLRPIPLGSSRELRPGQTVYAIGNPFGLQRTLTQGLISALDRELPTTDYREVAGVIQTDAAINPGNSGGPLLDSAGRLIGVNTAIRSASGSSAGIGFAIPADLVNRVVPALISRGRAPLPSIGIAPVRPDLVARAGLSGVVIADVVRGSPAHDAGLKGLDRRTGEVGDIIVAVNGKRITSLSGFVGELDKAGVDNTAELTVLRGDQERRLRVKVVDGVR
ncbi:trypsin-like peptidase domain-containing protein [Ideonella sp. 4Y16]|uniref:Trypsin-like peptidase domain-containing protein n=1 Tax=Ideonella alba TaxID=2824118 RepID=A0A941BN09_9BURK|nr:trypsin-like peptidase domain-containing protein [Ideonella alba]MBQ0932824.1 trypsin-like peptidase domain-containing protein [Ideonella alba]MBQ0945960.1 trypsin-like peptidase domain-containing protein [Ideonella alba]